MGLNEVLKVRNFGDWVTWNNTQPFNEACIDWEWHPIVDMIVLTYLGVYLKKK